MIEIRVLMCPIAHNQSFYGSVQEIVLAQPESPDFSFSKGQFTQKSARSLFIASQSDQ